MIILLFEGMLRYIFTGLETAGAHQPYARPVHTLTQLWIDFDHVLSQQSVVLPTTSFDKVGENNVCWFSLGIRRYRGLDVTDIYN